MKNRRSQFQPALSFANETLESRIVMTAGATQSVAEVAAHNATTHTTLAITAGTLGQPITFTVTVRAAASAGSPTGTVNIIDHGQSIGTLTLYPSTTAGKYAYSTATGTFTPQPGGTAYFFGKHTISADFVPTGSFAKSNTNKTFSVSQPVYTTLSDGVKIANIAAGSGPAITTGQSASVFYTGYLAKSGKIFDDSLNDGGTPFTFELGAGQVIPGFNEGTLGMQAGETRIVEIPAAQAYGSTAQSSIPANSTLIFVVTLESIANE